MELGIKVAQVIYDRIVHFYQINKKPICPSDGLFTKVSCNNALMRSSLMACNILRCLTLFKNTMMNGDDDHSKEALPNYDLHLSMLKLIRYNEINDWKIKYTLNLMKKLRSILFCLDNQLNYFRSENLLRKVSIAFLFHIDVTMNKVVCMIHEGSKIPSRGSKCSSLIRKFSRNGEKQYNLTRGEEKPKLIFGSNVLIRIPKKNRSLGVSEYRNMQENLEHDRMVCGNYDRQSIAFFSLER